MSLHTQILERIQREGALTFAEYMQMALYEPEYGYYVSGPARMGWEGDYFTSTDVSDLFAACLGRQLLSMWHALGEPTPFRVLEQGSGRGHLAAGVESWAKQEQPAFFETLHYQTADIRLGLDVRDPPLVSDTEPFHVILSNELIDAFPVHIVEKRGEQLYEIYVEAQNGRLYEAIGEPGSPQIAHYLDDYAIPWQTFPDGWRAEINLALQGWLDQCVPQLYPTSDEQGKGGFLLVIDYGDKAQDLYNAWRERGTLSCYYQHQLTERPLLKPGEQDITAHVNFSALISEGEQRGLHVNTYTTQREWLQSQGIFEELERIRARDFSIIDTDRASDRGQAALFQWYNIRQRVQTLTDPHGMGNFKVLIMQR